MLRLLGAQKVLKVDLHPRIYPNILLSKQLQGFALSCLGARTGQELKCRILELNISLT